MILAFKGVIMSMDFGRVCALHHGGSKYPYNEIYRLCSLAVDLPENSDLPKRLREIWTEINFLLPADAQRAPSWDKLTALDSKSLQKYSGTYLGEKIILCQQRVFAATSGASLPLPIAMEPFAEVIKYDERLVTPFEELVKGFEGEIEYPGFSERVVYKIAQIRKLFTENSLLLSFFKNMDLQAYPELKKVVNEYKLPEPVDPAPVPRAHARWATREYKSLSRQDLAEKGWQLSECSELIFIDCDLDLCELIDLLPSHLTELHLINCGIKAVPETIGKLKELHTLYLNKNPLECFPLAICNLPKLERLHLEECGLSALPEGLGGFEALKSIELSRNKLTRIPEALQLIATLTSVYLCGNSIEEFPRPDDISTEWKVVDISCNPITSFPLDLFKVLEKAEVFFSREMDGEDLLEPYYNMMEEMQGTIDDLEDKVERLVERLDTYLPEAATSDL